MRKIKLWTWHLPFSHSKEEEWKKALNLVAKKKRDRVEGAKNIASWSLSLLQLLKKELWILPSCERLNKECHRLNILWAFHFEPRRTSLDKLLRTLKPLQDDLFLSIWGVLNRSRTKDRQAQRIDYAEGGAKNIAISSSRWTLNWASPPKSNSLMGNMRLPVLSTHISFRLSSVFLTFRCEI